MKAAIFMEMKQMDNEKCLIFINPTFTTHKHYYTSLAKYKVFKMTKTASAS